MIDWLDIASIMFVCVTANHLGLIKAIETVTNIHGLPVINCPKCLTYWCVLLYTIFVTRDVITSLAISFLCSYLALWLELLEGYVDTLYMIVYEKIYSDNADNETATGADGGNSAGTMP